tara:strand:- start:571 stop:954 length:384 start_codon:yes stop_codon:yes gene_type:complete
VTAKIVLQLVIKNWKSILMVLLSLGIIGKMRYDYKQLQRAYEVTEDSLKAQIDGLKDIHQREIAAREEILNEYHDLLKQIENDYAESQDALQELIESRRADYGRQFSEDPASLVDDIQIMYGFDYVP